MILVTSLVIGSIILAALADGLNDTGHKEIGHILEALEKPALILAGLFSGTWVVVIIYIGYRVFLFDYLRNLAAGEKLIYLGTSSLWDKFLRKYPWHGVLFAKTVFLIMAVGLTFRAL